MISKILGSYLILKYRRKSLGYDAPVSHLIKVFIYYRTSGIRHEILKYLSEMSGLRVLPIQIKCMARVPVLKVVRFLTGIIHISAELSGVDIITVSCSGSHQHLSCHVVCSFVNRTGVFHVAFVILYPVFPDEIYGSL